MHRETKSTSNTAGRSMASPVQVAQELWQRVQEDMEVKESHKWLQHRMEDAYHHHSLDDSKFHSPPHVVKRLVSVPNLVASREVSAESFESMKEMDPEMGVADDDHSPPLSLKRFTQVNQLNGSQQDRLLQAIAQIASPMKQKAPLTPPPVRRHSLDLSAAVEDDAQRNRNHPNAGSKSTWWIRVAAVCLVWLVVTIIRMSSKFQIKCLWFRCNHQPPHHQQHHDVQYVQPSATTANEDKNRREKIKTKVNQRYQINKASRRQDVQGRFVESNHVVNLDNKQQNQKRLVERSCVVSSTGECLSIIHTPSDERVDVSVGKMAQTKLIDLPYTEIFQRGSFKHHGANPHQRQHEEELKKDANVENSAATTTGYESTPAEKLEVARNWNKVHSGSAKVFHRRHVAGVSAPTHRNTPQVEHDEECTARNVPMFAHWGDLDLLRWCVSQHPEWVDYPDENEWTALHEAAVAGWLDIVEYLVSAGASLKVVNNRERTAYREALHGLGPHHEVTKFLQKYEPAVLVPENVASSEQVTRAAECKEDQIQSFAYMGDLFELQRCLSLHPEWMSKEYDRKWTPLHFAATAGNTNVVEYLVKAGANVQARTEQGHLALELALKHLGREHPLTQILLGNSSEPESTDPTVGEPQKQQQVERAVEDTEKHTKEDNKAASSDHAMVETAGSVASQNDDGCLPQQIQWLAYVGKLEELQRCLGLHPTLISHADERGWTPIHESARAGHTHVIEYLLQAGANAEASTEGGHTALDLAMRKGEDHPAAQLLLRHKPAQQQTTDKPSPVSSNTESGTEAQPSTATKTPDASNTPAQTTVQESGGQSVGDDRAKQEVNCTPEQLKRSIHLGQLVEVQHCISVHPEYATRVDDLGWTPLHEASRSGQSEIAKYLLQVGAYAGALNKVGSTALDLAVERHGQEHGVTRLLKEHSEQTPRTDNTPTATLFDVELKQSKADPVTLIESPQKNPSPSETPAVEKANEPISGAQGITSEAATTNSGGDNAADTTEDCSAFHFLWSASLGELENVQRCLSLHPGYITTTDENGWTGLHEAVRSGHLQVVEYLLQAGADLKLLTTNGKHSSLDLARHVLGEDHAVTGLLKTAASS